MAHLYYIVTKNSILAYFYPTDLKIECEKFVNQVGNKEDLRLLTLLDQCKHKTNTDYLVSILSPKLARLFPQLYKSREFLRLDVDQLIALLSSDNVLITRYSDIQSRSCFF